MSNDLLIPHTNALKYIIYLQAILWKIRTIFHNKGPAYSFLKVKEWSVVPVNLSN